MLFLIFFAHFSRERFFEIWLGQESVTHGQTNIHGGKNNICLPRGRHIKTGLCVVYVYSFDGFASHGQMFIEHAGVVL